MIPSVSEMIRNPGKHELAALWSLLEFEFHITQASEHDMRVEMQVPAWDCSKLAHSAVCRVWVTSSPVTTAFRNVRLQSLGVVGGERWNGGCVQPFEQRSNRSQIQKCLRKWNYAGPAAWTGLKCGGCRSLGHKDACLCLNLSQMQTGLGPSLRCNTDTTCKGKQVLSFKSLK
jgi:hypothetical protein